MENQHRQIAGYRELSQGEVDLMNRIKALGAELGDLVAEVRGAVPPGEQQRWAATAATTLQTGLMQLTRAVANPTTF